MRILVLTKRQYMGRDVLSDRYGRFFELPEQLAGRGHAVAGVTIAYHRRVREPATELVTDAGVRWDSVDAWPWLPLAAWCHRQHVRSAVRGFRPDVLLGCSDAFHCVLAARLGRVTGIPVLLDLYDQFEAYGATRLPGVRGAFRRAIAAADAITCVSPLLRDWVVACRGRPDGVTVLGNAVNARLFFARDPVQARQRLGLPPQGILVGTAGSLMRGRAIETLYQAFQSIAARRSDVHLVVAGRRDRDPPAHARLHDLRDLPHHEVPWLFSALDVGVVCNASSEFARYCHPQKLVEMQACGLPVVMADTFAGTVEQEAGRLWLYRPGDEGSLADAIEAAAASGTRRARTGLDWAQRAVELEGFLEGAVRAGRSRFSAGTSTR